MCGKKRYGVGTPRCPSCRSALILPKDSFVHRNTPLVSYVFLTSVIACIFGYLVQTGEIQWYHAMAVVHCIHILSTVILLWMIVHQKKIATKAAKRPSLRVKIPEPIRQEIWFKHNGNVFQRLCGICEITMINTRMFHCGHIVSLKNGGSETVENYMPMCQMCNLNMGTENAHDYRARILLARGSHVTFRTK